MEDALVKRAVASSTIRPALKRRPSAARTISARAPLPRCPRRDVFPPGAARAAACFDQLLEPLEIADDPAPVETCGGADRLHKALGLIAQREMHERPIRAEL